jgi:hypothetical protein
VARGATESHGKSGDKQMTLTQIAEMAGFIVERQGTTAKIYATHNGVLAADITQQVYRLIDLMKDEMTKK